MSTLLPSWREAIWIGRQTGLFRKRAIAGLGVYYAATIVSALLDGVGLVLLLSAVTGRLAREQADSVTSAFLYLLSALGLSSNLGAVLLWVTGLLSVKAMIQMAIIAIEARFTAWIRRSIQQAMFSAVLNGDWESTRNLRVGKTMGAITEETQHVTRYVLTALRSLYFSLNALVFGGIALLVSPGATLMLGLVGLPLLLLLRWLFAKQATLSAAQTTARQQFIADVNERLQNLFLIKAEGSENRHWTSGMRHQHDIAHLEVLIGYSQSIIVNFNSVLVAVALGAFLAWHAVTQQPLSEALHLLASVSVVGARAAAQINNVIASLGNLSRFSGSIEPVWDVLTIPAGLSRQPAPEPITAIGLEHVVYQIDGKIIASNIDIAVRIGDPLVLRGPSGSGKTTIANLIAGIYSRYEGKIAYHGRSGTEYNPKKFRARIAYVTQDTFLFHGSVRQNLAPLGDKAEDKDLVEALRRAGALAFVEILGGLDGVIAEAGRSLSGGERRRLGIARALASKPDILILDELTNGLDHELKEEIIALMEGLATDLVVIAVTHDPQEFATWREWRTGALPAPADQQSAAES